MIQVRYCVCAQKISLGKTNVLLILNLTTYATENEPLKNPSQYVCLPRFISLAQFQTIYHIFPTYQSECVMKMF